MKRISQLLMITQLFAPMISSKRMWRASSLLNWTKWVRSRSIHGLVQNEFIMCHLHVIIFLLHDFVIIGKQRLWILVDHWCQFNDLIFQIAMGMTIYKKEENSLKLKNGFAHHENGKNGTNGTSLALQHYRDTNPTLTDVIWSRMDIANPISNQPSHADKCNTFLCGFISCCIIMAMGCAVALLSDSLLQV